MKLVEWIMPLPIHSHAHMRVCQGHSPQAPGVSTIEGLVTLEQWREVHTPARRTGDLDADTGINSDHNTSGNDRHLEQKQIKTCLQFPLKMVFVTNNTI